jgi:maleate cis-trans isomerase
MAEAGPEAIRLIGIAKPTKRGAASHALLVGMLPPDVRTIVRYSPVVNGTMEEFETALPFYERMTAELAEEGAQLVHLEGTPPFLILGYEQERRTLDTWSQRYGVPIFTSATCQVDALRALGVRRLVDVGYDPTTGPVAEAYFRDAGFDVIAVEKAPVEWGASGDISDDEAFDMLSAVLRRHDGADGLCLQGSSKWRLTSLIPRLEEAFGIVVVHPVAARYWELMHRIGHVTPRDGLGRLLESMPPRPAT